MAFRDDAPELVGEWSGHNRLWLGPHAPARESPTQATVTTAAKGGFLVLTYTWSDGGEPHDGVLIARLTPGAGPADMVWFDSFHTQGFYMRESSLFHQLVPDARQDTESASTPPGDGPA